MNLILTPWRTKMFKRILIFLFVTQSYLHAQTEEEHLFQVSASKNLLGTQVAIVAVHPSIKDCKKALYFAFQEIERIENLLSSHKEASEISKINKKAGISPVKVSTETYSIIKRALAYSKQFDGIFDISIGPISELWGFNDDDQEITIPKKEELNALLRLVNYRNIVLSEQDTAVLLNTKGMKLDLGGIAKGYAIDR
ncbi:MAG: FAD:protein FMN transferase, partial [bacterium]